MNILISDHAEADLLAGYWFYERQSVDVGDYFLDALASDVDSLVLYAGTHRVISGYYRALSHRFPFAIYYTVEGENVRVWRVLDCRRNPTWIRRQLRGARPIA